MANIESLLGEFRDDSSGVFFNPEPPAIPLAPVSRPTIPEAASMHDLAYGGNESPFALTAQKLFENRGIISSEKAAEMDIKPKTIHPLVEVGEGGEIISGPIILYFAEER